MAPAKDAIEVVCFFAQHWVPRKAIQPAYCWVAMQMVCKAGRAALWKAKDVKTWQVWP
jgi:hypothetical protein